MPELQVPEEGSVRSVPQVMHRAAAQASQPYPLVNRIALGIVTALLAVGLPLGAFTWGIDPSFHQFRAASSISIERLSCVSVEDVKYDGKEFSDPELVDAVVEILGIDTVLFNADYEACPWGLFLTVTPKSNPTVRYDYGAADYFVSAGICVRGSDGRMKLDDCVSTDSHLVGSRGRPLDLFKSGLLGLLICSRWGCLRDSHKAQVGSSKLL